MNTIGIGLVGCGGRLRGIVDGTLKAANGAIRVEALCDPCEYSRNKAKEMFNPAATVHENAQALARDPKVNWVFVGSWNCFHAEQAIAAFEAGKNVFCEKPLATNLKDCLAMRDAWKKSGRAFVIGFTLRYSAHYRKIKELLEAGKIGKLISMEFNETLAFNHGGYIHGDWRRRREWAGTHLLEKCCHDVDLVNWMVGSPAVRAASFGGCNFFTPENAKYVDAIGPDAQGREAFRTWEKPEYKLKNPFTGDKDIIDNQVAILEFANKVRTTFHTNCCAGIPERRMYLVGTEGAIRADVLVGSIQLQRYGWDTKIEDVSTDASGGHGGGDETLVKCLADCVTKNAKPFTTLEDGLRSAITCFAVDEAMDTGKIVDVRPYWKQAGLPLPA